MLTWRARERPQEPGEGDADVGAAVLAAVVGGGNRSSAREQSSLTQPPLRIMGQSYYLAPALGSALRSLGVTASAQGVTGRRVLIATAADNVLALDRRFLDPRRPLRPSRDDAEEGLVPYQEWLPLHPQFLPAGGQRVARVERFEVAPARVESTCHWLALGLDLYYGRLAPSATFDLIGDDFSYALLAATLAALTVGTAVAHGAVKRDDLARRWK